MGVHIGKKIKEELYRQGLSVSSFARKINRTRNVVYDIFERESIDTALLNKICLVLRVDFFTLYSDQKEYRNDHVAPLVVNEERVNYLAVNEQIKQLRDKNEALENEVSYLKRILELMEKDKPGNTRTAKRK